MKLETEKEQVAILIATYNGEKYLKAQIDSLLNQTYSNIICYIHDDGSSDHTEAVIDEYANKYSKRVIKVSGANTGKGAKENFRYLLKYIEAELYMFCDQDDIWEKTKVEECVEAIRFLDQTKPACIYTDLKVVGENLNLIDSSFYHYTGLDPLKNTYKDLIMHNVCAGCTMIINRSLRDAMLDLHSQHIAMHDQEAALIAALTGNLFFLDRNTILYRQHNDNEIGASKRESAFDKGLVAIKNVRKYLDKRKRDTNRPREIANDMLELKGLSEEKKTFLSTFAEIGNKRKIDRMRFYADNSLFRQKINKLWQMWRIVGV